MLWAACSAAAPDIARSLLRCWKLMIECGDRTRQRWAMRLEIEEGRFRGEAVAAVVGKGEAVEKLDLQNFPVSWKELPPLTSIDNALAPGAPLVHLDRKENVLVRGRVVRDDVEKALAEAAV